jgi:phage FluMu gp28-like protein
MTALPSAAADLQSARLITEAEWARIRRESLDLAPAVLREIAAGDIGSVLLPYQRKLLETTAVFPVTVVEKSRRTGVTWAAAADAVLTSAAARDAGGMDTLYIGYNLDMAREFIDTAAMWARAFDQATTDAGVEELMFDDGPDGAIQAFRIRFASGFEIVALSSKPRSLRGRQGYVILDEFAFHDDADELLKAAMALLIWGGKVLVISTHNGEDNPYNKLIQDIRAGRKPYGLLRVDFDEALHDALYQRICLVTGKQWSIEAEAAWRAGIIAFYGDGADEELYCIPSQGGGVVLPRALLEARARRDIPVIRLEKPAAFAHEPEPVRRATIDDWCERELLPILASLDKLLSHALGVDFGRVADLSVFWPLTTLRTLKRRTPFIVELRNIPFEQQRQVGFYIGDRLPRFSAAKLDATGNGAYLAEVFAQRYGENRVEQVKLSSSWYLDNVPPFKAAFEDDMIEIPADDDIVRDLATPVFKNGIASIPDLRTKGQDGRKRHADAFVAGVLSYAASRADVIDYRYTPVTMLDRGSSPFAEDQPRGRRLW